MYNDDTADYDMENSSYALRNERYKLMHVHQYNTISEWYSEDYVTSDDDNYAIDKCDQSDATTGNMTYFLFDLLMDKNETQNLYTTDESSSYYSIIANLTNQLNWYVKNNVHKETRPTTTETAAAEQFEKVGYITPWDFTGEDSDDYDAPTYCTPSSLFTS
jgi:hypothetical protein